MRRVFLALSLLICLDLSARGLEPPRANEKWTTLRVDEFELVSNASPKATMEIARDLVRMRAAIGALTRMKVRSPLPTKVFIFDRERSFAPYREAIFGRDADSVTGLFLGGDDGNFILLQSDARDGVDRIVFHELTHYFIKNTVPGLPLWLNEGFAEYYSTFRTSGNDVHIGRPVADHVLWLREEPLIPLPTLFAIDRDSPEYNESARAGVFYAESWALLHYLLLGNEERREQFSKFLGLLGARKPVDEAFTTAFGTTYPQIERELRQYVRRPTFHYMKYPLGDLAVSEVPSPEPMTHDAALYAFGYLLARADRSTTSAAETFLAEALKANASHAGAHAELGRLYDIDGRAKDAEAEYQRAVQLGSTDAEIYLRCGVAIVNRHAGRRDVPPDELAKARKLFEKSTQLDPSLARAWAGLGATYIFEADFAPGIAALEKSLALAPADEEAAFYLVQLYARAGRRAEAQKLVDSVIAPSGDRRLLSHAREAVVAAEIEEVRTLANARKYKEAIALAKSVMTRTSDPALLAHLSGMLQRMEEIEARAKP